MSGDDIGAEAAWTITTDCTAAVVAVVDTGVNYLHEDLAANMWNGTALHGADFVDDDGDPMDEHGHGTHVAGIIAARANNGVGGAGVCWTARIMAVRVLDRTGGGSTATIVQGLEFARTNGAQVMNLSLGGPGYDPAFASAVDAAVNAGAVVVVAAGNEGADNDTSPSYPCNFPSAGILCVAALDQRFQLASFSNWGASSVDIAAPGTNIVATWPGTQSAVDETFTGWAGSSTSGTGFHPVTFTFGTHSYAGLADPSTNTTYPASTDDRTWKSFNTAGADYATVDFYLTLDVSTGDHARIACNSSGTDPFAAGGTLLDDATNVFTRGVPSAVGYDLTACRSATSALGFQLAAAPPASAADHGVGILLLTVRKLTVNAVSYNVEHGTSMATPVAAGVAALVKAYQPAFTPADLVGAITGGGRPVSSLANKVKSGKAVDALGALQYVNPPRGLTYTVQ